MLTGRYTGCSVCAGVTEGDVGHTTFSRAADKLWTRGDVAPDLGRTVSAQRDRESRVALKATARM